MSTHPDELAREEMLRKSQTKHRAPFPSWNGQQLKVQKLDDMAIVPTKANRSDAGYDLYALDGAIVEKTLP